MRVNYNGYSKTTKDEEPEKIVESVEDKIDESTEGVIAESEVATVTATGTVIGCTKLNIRTEPNLNGDVLCTIPCNSKVVIDETESTDDWFKVCAENGAEGFCMKKYIAMEPISSL